MLQLSVIRQVQLTLYVLDTSLTFAKPYYFERLHDGSVPALPHTSQSITDAGLNIFTPSTLFPQPIDNSANLYVPGVAAQADRYRDNYPPSTAPRELDYSLDSANEGSATTEFNSNFGASRPIRNSAWHPDMLPNAYHELGSNAPVTHAERVLASHNHKVALAKTITGDQMMSDQDFINQFMHSTQSKVFESKVVDPVHPSKNMCGAHSSNSMSLQSHRPVENRKQNGEIMTESDRYQPYPLQLTTKRHENLKRFPFPGALIPQDTATESGRQATRCLDFGSLLATNELSTNNQWMQHPQQKFSGKELISSSAGLSNNPPQLIRNYPGTTISDDIPVSVSGYLDSHRNRASISTGNQKISGQALANRCAHSDRTVITPEELVLLRAAEVMEKDKHSISSSSNFHGMVKISNQGKKSKKRSKVRMTDRLLKSRTNQHEGMRQFFLSCQLQHRELESGKMNWVDLKILNCLAKPTFFHGLEKHHQPKSLNKPLLFELIEMFRVRLERLKVHRAVQSLNTFEGIDACTVLTEPGEVMIRLRASSGRADTVDKAFPKLHPLLERIGYCHNILFESARETEESAMVLQKSIFQWLYVQFFEPDGLPVTGFVKHSIESYERKAFEPLQSCLFDFLGQDKADRVKLLNSTSFFIIGMWYKNLWFDGWKGHFPIDSLYWDHVFKLYRYFKN